MKKGNFTRKSKSLNASNLITSTGIFALDNLLQGFYKNVQQLVPHGHDDGAQNKPRHDQIEPSDTEQSMLMHATKAQNNIELIIVDEGLKLNSEKEELETHDQHLLPQQVRDEQQELKKESNIFHEIKRTGKAKLLGLKVRGSTASYEMIRQKWLDQIRKLKELKGVYDANHSRHIAQGKHLHIKKGFDLTWLYWLFLILLMSIEIFANFSAIKEASSGGQNLMLLGSAIIFAAGQLFSAIHLGDALQKWSPMVIFHGALFVVCCLVLGKLRWDAEDEIIFKWAFAGLNFVLGVLMSWASFKRAKHRNYYQNLNRRNDATLRLKILNQKLVELEEEQRFRVKQVGLKVEHDAQKIKVNTQKNRTRRLKQITMELEQLDAKKKQALQIVKEIYSKALKEYRTLNSNARVTSGHPPVAIWQRGDDDPTPTQVLDGSNDPLGTSPLSKIASLLILIFGLGLSACGNKEEVIADLGATHIEILYDVTGDNETINTQAMVDYVMSQVDINEESYKWNETHLTLSQITELSVATAHSIHLNASQDFWLRDDEEHEKAITKFKYGLRDKIALVTQASVEQSNSHIHRQLHSRLNEIVKEEGTKKILIWTDLMQFDRGINFYDYLSNPEKLLEEKDSIIQLMEKGYALPDLEDVHIIVHHQPTKAMDEIFQKCKKLFRTYWENKGATVEFRSSPVFAINNTE